MKLKYQMVIQWSEEDNCFLVGFPDFPGDYLDYGYATQAIAR
jgi:hypothetical protein